jgi:hypothetical protein
MLFQSVDTSDLAQAWRASCVQPSVFIEEALLERPFIHSHIVYRAFGGQQQNQVTAAETIWWQSPKYLISVPS